MNRIYDAIVIGLGGIGSAALFHLARRGLRVLGIEQYDVPNAMGSSHGASRVIRKAYSEDPRYVPLLERSYQLWRELEDELGEQLLWITGALHFGRPDEPGIAGVEAAVAEHGLACERLDAAEIRARFPALAAADDQIGLLEPEGGFLAAPRCVSGHAERALHRGAEVRGRERVFDLEQDDGSGQCVVRTEQGTYRAARLVICGGGWLAGPSPLEIGWPLEVERQVQCWFAPREPEHVELGRMPVFICHEDGEAHYGLPRWRHPGVKVCRHHGGQITNVDIIDREPRPYDIEQVRRFVEARVPAAAGPPLAARTCFYTNTPDHHFAIGPHPMTEAVLVAGGFSGHGFKLAPVIGEVLADLVEKGSTEREVALFDPRRFPHDRS